MSQYALVGFDETKHEQKVKRVSFVFSIHSHLKFYKSMSYYLDCDVNCSKQELEDYIINTMRKKLNHYFDADDFVWRVRVISKRKLF